MEKIHFEKIAPLKLGGAHLPFTCSVSSNQRLEYLSYSTVGEDQTKGDPIQCKIWRYPPFKSFKFLF